MTSLSLFGSEAAPGSLAEPLGVVLDRVPADWRPIVDAWRHTPEGRALVAFVDERVAAAAIVYPAQVFAALALTPLAEVRVVLLGQDPYHGPGQAHGLAFSVPEGARLPPSLRNIFAELQCDLGISRISGNLTGWARQGVLLLNTTLTVEDGAPASHARRGWESLTESILRAVAARPQACAYLLWGAHAQQFEALIRAGSPAGTDPLILKANHPSPLAARRPPVPFTGCGHFGRVRRYLQDHGFDIDWAR